MARQASGTIAMRPVEYETVFMKGGWDLATPTLSMYAGALRDVQNFEVSEVTDGGYTRVAGYERFNGKPAPHLANYFIIQVASFTNVPSVGQTLTGFTSGATGVILVVASNYMVLTKPTGTFLNTEVVKVGGTTIGTSVPTMIALSSVLDAQYLNLAADNYRADIAAVPGSGPVRGVVALIVSNADVVYAFRDNAGATAVDIYKSTGTGWTQVSLYNEVSFTAGGTGTPVDGNTLTQGGVTATIKRVMHQSGSFSGSTAAGRFIITNPTGGNFAAGAATAGSVGVTLSGIQTVITITVGGKYQFDIGNFAGQAATIRAYGCDNVNRGFEFDGDVYAPITTGTTPDAPTNVKVHKLHLFFSFGSSIIHSGVGFPYKWTAADGASELGCGDIVTTLLNQPGSQTTAAMGITTRSNTLILYGTGLTTWNLTSLNVGIGGISYTGQLLNESYWMDSQGVIGMRAVQAYGNFRQATISTNISDYIITQRGLVAYSVVNRSKNQYRIYFTDGSFLVFTIINGKLSGVTKGLHTDVMRCAWSSTGVNLEERVFCGAVSSGHVYQMDQGSSFDGANIEAFLVFNWNSMKSPRIRKRMLRVSVEMQSDAYASFNFGYSLGYGTPDILQPAGVDYDAELSQVPYWDTFIWDAFVWDGVSLMPTEVEVRGTAENIQVTLASGTDYIYPFTINSLIFHFIKRRGMR